MTSKRPLPGELEPIERASRDELQALQLERLQWSLQHAYANVEHYRKAFDAKGIHPSDLKSLADLAKFPFTVKSDLRDNYPFGLFAVPRERVARLHASSGTTGKPTVVGYTLKDIDNWADLVARSIRAAGGRPGDMVHIAYGYGLFTGGLGAHYGAERAGCTVIPMSGGQTEKQVQLITDLKPNIIMVTPSYMQVLVEELARQGIDPTSTSLEVGIFGAEPWTEAMRAEIEASAGIDAVDIYGLSEVMGPGVASECVETKDGPVVWEDHFYPEIIDPETGEVLPDGEEGELVFTTLTKEALPVDPLPHPRPDAPPAADRALDAPHGQDRRPQRRHADHPRRQPVPDPDRGAGARSTASSRASTSSWSRAKATSTTSRCAASCCRRTPAPTARRSARRSRQRIKTLIGITTAVTVGPARQPRAHARRQGEAGHRPEEQGMRAIATRSRSYVASRERLARRCAGAARARRRSPIPVATFVANPDIADAKLSPSGKYIALAIVNKSGRTILAVVRRRPGRSCRSSSPTSPIADIRAFDWVNDDWLVFNLVDLQVAGWRPGLRAGTVLASAATAAHARAC